MKAPTIVELQFKPALEVRHGTTPAKLRALIKPLFLWMYDHGVKDLQIARTDKKALVTVDSQRLDAPAHPDDDAVDRFALAMKAKLATARAKGRSGWDDSELCTDEYLSVLLRDHVTKGDPVDVANFSMMLHQRGSGIIATQEREEHQADADNWRMKYEMCNAAFKAYLAVPAPEDALISAVNRTLEIAEREGVVVTIKRRPLQPLAMGHAEYVIETWPVRGAA